MKILLQFAKIVKKFLSLKLKDKGLIIGVFFLTGIIRFIILTIPFKYFSKYLGVLNKESSYMLTEEQYSEAKRIALAISRVSKHTIWESKCLVQSMTAQILLNLKNIENTLYLGVAKDKSNGKMVAHSWIRCGDFFVTGGNGQNFSTVARFMKKGTTNCE